MMLWRSSLGPRLSPLQTGGEPGNEASGGGGGEVMLQRRWWGSDVVEEVVGK